MKTAPLVLALLVPVASYASTVSGRLDFIQGREPLSARASVKPELDFSSSRFRFHGEALLEADALDKLPYSDGQRARALLQEAYVEADLSPFTVRLGLQPVRWSESWSLPSLDFWTARRWDRYFLDPLADVLKHPIGALIRYSSQDVELEGFASVRTPTDSFADGVGEVSQEWRAEGGARAKFRVQGWDFSPAYAYVRKTDSYGFSLSYALASAVPKLEVGGNDRDAFFVIAGTDFFMGEWTLLPQLTFYRATPDSQTERILYLPIRYEAGRNTFEFQMLSTESGEVFWGSEFGRDFNDSIGASVFLQDYQGSGTGLISSFDTHVDGGWVTGLRLKATR
ncbi:MAG: hypothetical protein ABIR96_01420 [Bdellovibrionota bacterium]